MKGTVLCLLLYPNQGKRKKKGGLTYAGWNVRLPFFFMEPMVYARGKSTLVNENRVSFRCRGGVTCVGQRRHDGLKTNMGGKEKKWLRREGT